MKAILVIYLLLISCNTPKEPPLDEETIISRLVGQGSSKRWSQVKSIDIKNPEESKITEKCALDDEYEFTQEGFFILRVNEKCSKYQHDHALKWRIMEFEKKFYLDFYQTQFIPEEFQRRSLIEKITFKELVLKILENDEVKKDRPKEGWYIEKTPITGNYEYIEHFKSSN